MRHLLESGTSAEELMMSQEIKDDMIEDLLTIILAPSNN